MFCYLEARPERGQARWGAYSVINDSTPLRHQGRRTRSTQAQWRDNNLGPILIFRMTRLFVRGSVVAVGFLVAFNASMTGLWFAVGPSRDALVVGSWIAGDAMLCLIALWATDR